MIYSLNKIIKASSVYTNEQIAFFRDYLRFGDKLLKEEKEVYLDVLKTLRHGIMYVPEYTTKEQMEKFQTALDKNLNKEKENG